MNTMDAMEYDGAVASFYSLNVPRNGMTSFIECLHLNQDNSSAVRPQSDQVHMLGDSTLIKNLLQIDNISHFKHVVHQKSCDQ